MSLDPKGVALQGFKRSPIMVAVQGLLDGVPVEPEIRADIFPFAPRKYRTPREIEDEEILFAAIL